MSKLGVSRQSDFGANAGAAEPRSRRRGTETVPSWVVQLGAVDLMVLLYLLLADTGVGAVAGFLVLCLMSMPRVSWAVKVSVAFFVLLGLLLFARWRRAMGP